ncbi:MAG: 3-hydroxyacyl-CoA dehydrogenase NAD-binding domain-containing protein [Planctomycetota bacterium]
MKATRLEWTDVPGDGARRVEGRVAVLVLDLPGKSANLLGSAMLADIAERLDQVDAAHQSADPPVAGLVIASAKAGVFVAGADLTEFIAGLDRPADEVVATCRRGQTLFARLASCDYPTVAAIDGVCVGGGLELAVWCDRRVATDSPKTQLAFPEVKLGLMPGWGGTVRTPRLVGLGNAVELVTGGENVSANEAYRLGLVDDLVAVEAPTDSPTADDGLPPLPMDAAESAVVQAAVRLVAAERGRDTEDSPPSWRADRERLAGPIRQSDTELMFLGATASAVIHQKTKGDYPAPMAALEVLLEGATRDSEAACELEAASFAPLFGSPENRALLNVFFLTDRAKRESRGPKSGRRSDAPIDRVGVVGAGIMGRGIAAANVRRGVAVGLCDSRADALRDGVEAVVREAAYNRATKGVDADLAIERSALVAAASGVDRLDGVDLLVEAIVENADAKRSLLAEAERALGPDAILASNTSTIPITSLAHGLERPERFAGLHFFNPVRKMPLVEVIRGAQTSAETVERLVAHVRRLGKTPVVVNDGPGFLVNRLLLPYMNEAALLATAGVPFREIDRAAKSFGMPMGPLELHDVVGLDTCLHAGRVMHGALPDRVVPAAILDRLVEAGRLGQKNGKGFYNYGPSTKGKPPRPQHSAEAAVLADEPSSAIEGELADRLLLPMLLEATRAIEDGIVRDVRDVDLALVLGIGFPPFRGGLFHWADTLGAAAIVERLEPLCSLGARFEPTETLHRHAREGRAFYDTPEAHR